MCKSICDNFSLKLLTFISLVIVLVDIDILKKTFTEYLQLKDYLDKETYEQCYKPQSELRIVFQCYAIYSAVICTVLTATLATSLPDTWVEIIARYIINLCYIAFGPVLLTFVQYGISHFKGLSFICSPRGITHHINFVDIALLLACFVFSIGVTFTMAMQKTLDMAQSSFMDENSLLYRLASMYFSLQVSQRQRAEREVIRQRASNRRDQRRQRQQQRADTIRYNERQLADLEGAPINLDESSSIIIETEAKRDPNLMFRYTDYKFVENQENCMHMGGVPYGNEGAFQRPSFPMGSEDSIINNLVDMNRVSVRNRPTNEEQITPRRIKNNDNDPETDALSQNDIISQPTNYGTMSDATSNNNIQSQHTARSHEIQRQQNNELK